MARFLIISSIFPPDIGGPATSVPQAARGLSGRGHDVKILTLSDRVGQDDRHSPFPVVRLVRGQSKPWRQVATIRAIVRLGRQADVLFVNGLALEAVVANYLLRKPLVMKVVGDLAWERATVWGWTRDTFESFQRRRHGLMLASLKRLRSWWTRKAQRVIVPSHYLARWVKTWGVPDERVVVIYNAVEPEDGVTPLPVPLATSVKLVTAGRLVPLKRVDGIIAAIAALDKVGLVVIGEGPERERLEQVASELGVTDRVYFAGARDRREMLGLMAACDLFVLNSTYEGLPHVVLDAMALGLPVIATAVGGTPEVVREGETGLLVGLESGALQGALYRLVLDPEERSRIGQHARTFVAREFNVEAMLKRTEAVLTEVCQ